ncbi:MAG: stage III sporulation protein AE, partial [Clostridiales bacterium]|nr:stage III sporulation protein AE [Clostridiales bacterium]
MKKVKITFLLMVLITITVFTLAVNAESTSDPSDSAYNTLKDNLSGVDPYLGDDLTPDKIMDSTLSGQGISSGSILSSVTQAILKELSGEIGVLVSITAIAYIISYISAIGDGSLGKNNEAAFMAAFAVLATQIVISFSTTAQWGFGAINDMELVMHSSIPLLAALSVNITAPSFLLTVQVAALVIQTV